LKKSFSRETAKGIRTVKGSPKCQARDFTSSRREGKATLRSIRRLRAPALKFEQEKSGSTLG